MSWVDVTTAVGTASAAVVALGLGLRAEWRAIRLERQARTEEERHQAIHVAAWMLVEQDDGDGIKEIDVDDPSFDRHTAHIYEVVQNASDEPIWDVIVRGPMFVEKKDDPTRLESSQYESEIISIGPHELHRSQITVMTIPFNRFPMRVEFRDNAGRDWSRDDRGRLSRGRSTEPSFAWIDEIAAERQARKAES